MKRFISALFTLSTLLIAMSTAPIVADTETLSDNVTLKSVVCDSNGTTVTAKMTFDTVLDCTVILAVYDDFGRLLNVTYKDSPKTVTDFNISLSGNQIYLNRPAKIFFWDSFNTLKPINISLNGIVIPDENDPLYDYIKICGIVTETPYSVLNGTKNIDTSVDKRINLHVTATYDTDNPDFNWSTVTTSSGTHLEYAGVNSFLLGNTNACDYLGYSVIAYVKKVNNSYEIQSITIDTNKADTIKIRINEFASYNNSTTGANAGNFVYYEGNSTSIVSAPKLSVVLNGDGSIGNNLNSLLANTLTFSGDITLIDNDDTTDYDVAIINIASIGVIKDVLDSKIILHNTATWYSKDTTSKIFYYPEDKSKVLKITKEGKEITVTDLQEWDVISIYATNADSDYIRINVLTNKTYGTISSRKSSVTSSIRNAYKMNNTWYDIAEGAYKSTSDLLDVGVSGTFYIDEFGRIVAYFEAPPIQTDQTVSSNLAIVTEYGMRYNDNAEEVLFISFVMDSEEYFMMETTHELFNNYLHPSLGDIVKFEFDSNNLISSIKYIWDFPYDIRGPYSDTLNEPVPISIGDNAYVPPSIEVFDGGVVTAFDNATDTVTINESTYGLLKAKNIYVIDATGRNLKIENGSVADFKYFPSLYNTTNGTLTLIDLSGGSTKTGDMSITENRLAVMKYADHIYIRTYEDNLTDVIIVKGFLDSVQ